MTKLTETIIQEFRKRKYEFFSWKYKSGEEPVRVHMQKLETFLTDVLEKQDKELREEFKKELTGDLWPISTASIKWIEAHKNADEIVTRKFEDEIFGNREEVDKAIYYSPVTKMKMVVASQKK